MSKERTNVSDISKGSWDWIFREVEKLYAERPENAMYFGSKDRKGLGGWYAFEDGHPAFYVHCTLRYDPNSNWDAMPLFSVRFRGGAYVAECNRMAATVYVYERACALADKWNKEV